jgi:hypothetical protein
MFASRAFLYGKENANETPLNLSVFCHKKAQKAQKQVEALLCALGAFLWLYSWRSCRPRQTCHILKAQISLTPAQSNSFSAGIVVAKCEAA